MEDWLYASYRSKTIGKKANTFDFHSHAQFEVYCFHSGDCKYLIQNAIYDLQPGDIIIMDGLTLHRANPATGIPYERSIVQFSTRWIAPLIEAIGTPEWLAPFKEMNNSLLRGGEGPERAAIYRAIQEMARLNEEPAEAEAELKLLVAAVLLNLYKLSKKANDRLAMPKSEKDVHVEKTAVYIQQHFQEKITLGRISDALSISKFYLSRVFKEVTGTTIMDYVMDCRLNNVKYELETNPARILSDIALESGFESPAHFSRFFKRKVGLTPSEYRRKKGGS